MNYEFGKSYTVKNQTFTYRDPQTLTEHERGVVAELIRAFDAVENCSPDELAPFIDLIYKVLKCSLGLNKFMQIANLVSEAPSKNETTETQWVALTNPFDYDDPDDAPHIQVKVIPSATQPAKQDSITALRAIFAKMSK